MTRGAFNEQIIFFLHFLIFSAPRRRIAAPLNSGAAALRSLVQAQGFLPRDPPSHRAAEGQGVKAKTGQNKTSFVFVPGDAQRGDAALKSQKLPCQRWIRRGAKCVSTSDEEPSGEVRRGDGAAPQLPTKSLCSAGHEALEKRESDKMRDGANACLQNTFLRSSLAFPFFLLAEIPLKTINTPLRSNGIAVIRQRIFHTSATLKQHRPYSRSESAS